MFFRAASCLLSLALWAAVLASAKLVRHDASWTPDTTLYATAANVSLDCESRYSVLLNGTAPGPVLYLEEGTTTWVRVYNQVPHHNITVVRASSCVR